MTITEELARLRMENARLGLALEDAQARNVVDTASINTLHAALQREEATTAMVRRQRDQARSIAVQFEQQNAQLSAHIAVQTRGHAEYVAAVRERHGECCPPARPAALAQQGGAG